MNENISIKRLGNIYGEQFGTGYAGNVWDIDFICPTLKVESGGGGRVPMIIEEDDYEGSRTGIHGQWDGETSE